MEESKRQKQVARLIEKEMVDIFRKDGFNMIAGGMLSIAQVKMTPDLLEARIYLSFFKIENSDEVMERIRNRTSEFRGALGNRLRHDLRRIPELLFFKDDTLEHAQHINDLLREIEEKEKNRSENKE